MIMIKFFIVLIIYLLLWNFYIFFVIFQIYLQLFIMSQILQCKPEFKVPGLYVIDSIVRQSRHQFGVDKDVFSPRFTKNIVITFTFLFKCPPEDRVSIVFVLFVF